MKVSITYRYKPEYWSGTPGADTSYWAEGNCPELGMKMACGGSFEEARERLLQKYRTQPKACAPPPAEEVEL